ncbi:hypothetical protein B9479_005623 [Cryptococcus floricola]|uniref:Protein kinase domain-containing protein n=1 Tax=Cryptococcus floricola TaxID=2591691 RepID=A0A5D3AV82_9TREE|nr:hypothetical protein B9479_005623 [Cryptococcus floricola]
MSFLPWNPYSKLRHIPDDGPAEGDREETPHDPDMETLQSVTYPDTLNATVHQSKADPGRKRSTRSANIKQLWQRLGNTFTLVVYNFRNRGLAADLAVDAETFRREDPDWDETFHHQYLQQPKRKGASEFVPGRRLSRLAIINAYIELHEYGILHHDVWPRNVTKHPVDGAPRIIDFEVVEQGERAARQADFEKEMQAVRNMVGEDDEGQKGTD